MGKIKISGNQLADIILTGDIESKAPHPSERNLESTDWLFFDDGTVVECVFCPNNETMCSNKFSVLNSSPGTVHAITKVPDSACVDCSDYELTIENPGHTYCSFYLSSCKDGLDEDALNIYFHNSILTPKQGLNLWFLIENCGGISGLAEQVYGYVVWGNEHERESESKIISMLYAYYEIDEAFKSIPICMAGTGAPESIGYSACTLLYDMGEMIIEELKVFDFLSFGDCSEKQIGAVLNGGSV